MNKSILIVLALISIVLLVSFGKIDAACDVTSSSTSTPPPDTDPVGYCKQFYNATGANPYTDCTVGRDSACYGGLVCIFDGNNRYRCECPIYSAIQSQIFNNSGYNCTSPLLDSGNVCYFKSGSPCAGDWLCVSTCINFACDER